MGSLSGAQDSIYTAKSDETTKIKDKNNSTAIKLPPVVRKILNPTPQVLQEILNINKLKINSWESIAKYFMNAKYYNFSPPKGNEETY